MIVLGIALAAGGRPTADAFAGTIKGSAVISAKADGPDFDCTITLTNTGGAGNDPIATFWLAWMPGADFLATSPISVTNPSGWTDMIMHIAGGSPDGYAIQWDALNPSDALAPGSSLVFGFKSADTSAMTLGNSLFQPTVPALTSTLFSQGPFSGDAIFLQVTPAAVPEPSSMALGNLAIGGTLAGRRLRREAKA
jgi:hypothetical protein